jgi:hypothetical protein
LRNAYSPDRLQAASPPTALVRPGPHRQPFPESRMSEHKFVVGQSVEFSPDWLLDKTTAGRYTIVRLFPNVGNLPQYRIKSERDGHERMVLEDRLDLGQ